MGIILLLVVVVIIIVCIVNSGSGESNIVYSMDSPEVESHYVRETVHFFDGYLSLCAKHSVSGSCSALAQSENERGDLNTKLKCVIIDIDKERGCDKFREIQRIWTLRRKEILDRDGYEAYGAALQAGDNYIKEYFGCEDLHWVYTEADEYQFNDLEVIISYDLSLFTLCGAKWAPTLSVIKQEILKKWENATVDVGPGGIIVKP